jgi:hypothetical protein
MQLSRVWLGYWRSTLDIDRSKRRAGRGRTNISPALTHGTPLRRVDCLAYGEMIYTDQQFYNYLKILTLTEIQSISVPADCHDRHELENHVFLMLGPGFWHLVAGDPPG